MAELEVNFKENLFITYIYCKHRWKKHRSYVKELLDIYRLYFRICRTALICKTPSKIATTIYTVHICYGDGVTGTLISITRESEYLTVQFYWTKQLLLE